MSIGSMLTLIFTTRKAERKIFLDFHREVFCWIDKWHGMTIADIRDLEERTRRELDEVSVVLLFLFTLCIYHNSFFS